jgi:NADH:ubiquinone oxidoreductase subunit 5 (subunit L)/multisubunit Na+/H+ antiporter MnhA subunit/multisubunit Na+/H+ antiporter MnhB subunit
MFSDDLFSLLSLAVAAPLLAIPLVLALGPRLRSASAWLALPGAALSVWALLQAGALGAWGAAPLIAARPWVPGFGLELAWRADGLGLFYGLVVSGMGVLVLIYSRYYLDEHAEDHGRFYAFLLLFMSAMLGTVLADDLLLLFCSWELTGLASFLLIGFFAGHSHSAAYGARRALLVTLSTGLGLLAALLLMKAHGIPTRISELLAQAPALSGLPDAALLMGLMLLAAFGKSAQLPFHFWLPGAMEAPTPVSAYLHSATMVKLGVFLAGRLYPLFHSLPEWSSLLGGVGGLTFFVGALGAYRRHDIKAVLAYTTLAQLGALFLWYGIAGAAGVEHVEGLALVLVLGHVFYKGGLFMVAGVAQHASGTRDLRQMGGLRRSAPWAAAAALLCAASMMGLPGSFGFLGKEALLDACLRLHAQGRPEGTAYLALSWMAAAFFSAVALRLVVQPFFGQAKAEHGQGHAPSFGLQAVPLALGLAGLYLGLRPQAAAEALGLLAQGGPLPLHESHATVFALSAGAWALGGALFLWQWLRPSAAPAPAELGALFDRAVLALVRFAGHVARFIRVDRPADYLTIIIAALALILGWELVMEMPPLPAGPYAELNTLEGLVLALMAGAGVAVVLAERWTIGLISLSTVGFLVCFFFMLQRAPDLALTQMLIESATLVLMLLLLGRFPQAAQAADEADKDFSPRKALAALLSFATAIVIFFLILYMTAHPHPRLMGRHFLEQTLPLAHGANAVNTVLVDFRGFDTMFEITVLCIAALGCLGLLMRPRGPHKAKQEGA